MKAFKKIMLLALAVIMVFSMVACNDTPDNTDEATPTPKPTPKVLACDVDQDQLNNYYVEFTITDGGETKKIIELGYSAVILRSEDGGETFNVVPSGQASFTLTDAYNDSSFFSSHLRYEKNQFENQGTETVAGKECTHYFFKNGLFKYHFYVDESFNTTGMTLKFVDEKVDVTGASLTKTIVVEKILFDVIDQDPAYSFASFSDKIPTGDEA